MKPLHDLSDDELAHQAQRALALPDAPPAWVQRAISLQAAATHPAGAVADLLATGLRAVVATLRFDSWTAAPGALAVRSGAGTVRHLLFSAAGRDVDLRISPAGDGFTLSGQVLGPDESGQVALVYAAAGTADMHRSHSAPVDELGEFRLAGLSGGTCTLTFHLGSDQVKLPPIALGDTLP